MPTLRTLASPLVLALPLVWAHAPTSRAAEPDPRALADDDALELDVVAVLSLPLAADDARDAGLSTEEVADVITAVAEVGASPAVATELLVAEAEAARKHGAKPNFSSWIRGQLAAGAHGKEMLAAIETREAEYIALTSAQRAELDRKLARLHDAAVDQRKAQWLKVGALVRSGKKLRVAGEAKLVELRRRVETNVARQKRLAEALATDPAKREAFEKLVAKVEARVDKAVDKAEKAVDKAGKAVDKAVDETDKAAKRADKAAKRADAATPASKEPTTTATAKEVAQ